VQPLLYSSQVAGSRASNLGGARAPSRGGDSWADSHHMNHHGGGGPSLRVSQQVCVCVCALGVGVQVWVGVLCVYVSGWVGWYPPHETPQRGGRPVCEPTGVSLSGGWQCVNVYLWGGVEGQEALFVSQQALYVSQQALCVSQQALYVSQQALCVGKHALCVNQQTCRCVSQQA